MLTMSQPHIISEADVRLFLQEARNPREVALKFAAALVMVSLVMGMGFISLNFGAFLRLYSTQVEPVKAAQVTQVAPPVVNVAPIGPPKAEFKAPTIPENSVSYAALNISAPISWDVPLTESIVQKQLLDGVIQIKGTAKPGEMGYTVITGHSSNYPWIKGSYNTIFAPLAKAQIGQTILVNNQNHEYTYTVKKIYEVKPTEVSLLQESSKTGGLRLITCTPIGTSLRRLVIEAEQTSPSSTTNTPFTPTVFSGVLPSAR